MIQSELPISLVLPEDFLNEETRDGFLVTQSTKAIWAIELDLLNEFMHVCEENNLSYYAIGGTLLGAIRHRGFIPWDDDIDIAMKREEYEKLHDTFNSVFVGSSVALLSVCYLLIIPFIKMYTRGVTDINYIWTWLPLGFCLVKLLSRSRMVAGNLTGIAGYAKQVSYVSLLEAVINIALSVILVGKFGIYGVLYATVIALLVKLIYVNYLADRKILNRKAYGTVILLLLL